MRDGNMYFVPLAARLLSYMHVAQKWHFKHMADEVSLWRVWRVVLVV